MSTLSTLLECVTDALVLFAEDGTVEHATRAACEIAACDQASLKGRRGCDILDPEGANHLASFAAAAREGDTTRLDTRFGPNACLRREVVVEAHKLKGNGLCLRLREISCPLERRVDREVLCERIIEAAPDLIILSDQGGRVVFANPSAQTYFRQGCFDMCNLRISDFDPTATPEVLSQCWGEVETKGALTLETVHHLPGRSVPVEVYVSPIEVAGELFNCSLFHDISERKSLEAQLQEAQSHLETLSLTDPLSGVGNRRRFDKAIREEYERHTRSGAPLSLLMVDVDQFKAYNDTYGHIAGDECLKQIGSALSEGVNREFDIVARYGGEEFACILPSTPHDGALVVAERLRERIENRALEHKTSRVRPIVTISIGVVTSTCRSKGSAIDLIKEADGCLYEAKSRGRNRVVGVDLTLADIVAA